MYDRLNPSSQGWVAALIREANRLLDGEATTESRRLMKSLTGEINGAFIDGRSSPGEWDALKPLRDQLSAIVESDDPSAFGRAIPINVRRTYRSEAARAALKTHRRAPERRAPRSRAPRRRRRVASAARSRAPDGDDGGSGEPPGGHDLARRGAAVSPTPWWWHVANPDLWTRSPVQAAWRPWMGPGVTAAEALASSRARALRDRQLAAWCGVTDGDTAEPFLGRLAIFDQRTPAWEARCALEDVLAYAQAREAVLTRLAEVEDTREGLLVRVDALIAELDSWRGT